MATNPKQTHEQEVRERSLLIALQANRGMPVPAVSLIDEADKIFHYIVEGKPSA